MRRIINSMLSKKETAALYRKLFTQYIANPLKEFSFKRLKSSGMYKITDEGILQQFQFQKDWYGTNQVDVRMTIHPIFKDMEYVSLEPGICFGNFINGFNSGHYWFSFKNGKIGEENFQQINSLIFQKAMPIFNRNTTIESVINIYENRSPDFKPPTSECWTFYDLAILYAVSMNCTESIRYFEKAAQSSKNIFAWYLSNRLEKGGEIFSKEEQTRRYTLYSNKSIDELYNFPLHDDQKWAIKLAKKCRDNARLITMDKNKIIELLSDNKKTTYSYLKTE